MSFEKAYNRLKEINSILTSQEIIDIDKLISLQNEAKELYDFCEKKLVEVTQNQN